MTTTHELTLDLHKKGELQRIDVVQGDAGTRLVELTLEASGGPWEIPAEAQPAVRYLKPDGSSGVYDQLPDGGSAFRFDGNVLTMELAPQLLTCAGPVQVQVELSYQQQRIATFAFLIVVEQAVAMDGETGDYVNWTKMHLPQVTEAEQGQYLQIMQVDEAGRVLELMPVDDPAAEVKAQLPTLESHILAVGQRVEDVSIDMADTIDLVSKAVIGPDTAKVGQILTVKTLGGNGQPMKCEAIDLPAGGSESGWELVANLTVEEAVQSITWDNLNYRELKIYAYNPEGTGEDAYVEPKVNGIALGSLIDKFAYSGDFFDTNAKTAEIRVFAFGDFAMLSLNDLRVFSKEAIGKYGEISSFTWTSVGKPENDQAIRAGGRYIVYGRK